LDVDQWLLCGAVALSIIAVTEIRKAFLRQTVGPVRLRRPPRLTAVGRAAAAAFPDDEFGGQPLHVARQGPPGDPLQRARARSPRRRIGGRSVASGGVSRTPACMSSKPRTAMSAGTRSPAVWSSRMAPIAIWSLAQTIASGRSRRGQVRISRTASWPLIA